MPGTELFGAEERKEVNDVMESGMLFRYNHDHLRNGHWKAREFEQAIAEWNGVKYAHACSSGSTAVAVSLACCGIGAGDEVIVPPFTFIATVEAVLLAGALPVFAEIDETLCLSAEGIRKAITPNTKAVVLVHMCGAMANLDEIVALCNEHNITLIEDTAQGFGGSYKGKSLGSYGKVGCFSFDFFKIITCGEGGAVIMNDEKLYDIAHQFADHGHNHIGDNRGMEGHPVIGFNYRIGELNAAIGVAQMRKLPYILSQQRKHKQAMQASLAKCSKVTFRQIPDAEGDSATFVDFFLPDAETTKRAVQALREAGVPSITGLQYWWENNYHYVRNWEHFREMKTPAKLHIHTVAPPQDYHNLHLPISDSVVSRLISLVVKVAWTDEQLQELCQKLESALSTI